MAINWWGAPSTIEKLPTYEPNQISAFNQLLQQGMQNYDPTQLEKFATQQFHQQIVPQLAERFTAGVGGRTTSPAFASQLGEAGAGLASRLAAMRSQQGLTQLQLGLTPQYEYMYKGDQPGVIPSAAEKLLTSVLQDAPGLAKKGTELYDWWQRRKGQQGQASMGQDVANAADIVKSGTDIASDIRSAVFPSTSDAQKMQAADKMQQMVQKQSALNALQQGGLKPATTAKDALATTAAVTPAVSTGVQAATGGGLAKAATAVSTYGPPIAAATAGLAGLYKILEGVGGMIRDRRRENQGPQPEALPANWNEMSGPEQYRYRQARQVSTPQGIVSHDAIRRMEYDLGIQPNDKLSWLERWNNIQAKKGGK